MCTDPSPSWIDPIFEFLAKRKVPEDKNEAKRIRYQANRYTIQNGELYKRGYAMPYLRYLRPDEVQYVMKEIHEGVCENHSGEEKPGLKSPQARVPLADHVERLSGLCSKMWQVPKIRPHPKTTSWTSLSRYQSLAIHKMGDRSDRPSSHYSSTC